MAAISARGAVSMPADFNCSFADGSLEEWIMTGSGATPVDAYAGYFADGPFAVMNITGGKAAMSCSQFADGSESNEWLISPEFEVTDDNMVLYYTVVVKGNTIQNKYSVMISEGGTDRADFTVVANNTVKGSSTGESRAQRRHQLKGYKGKRVRLALVNKGNTTGLLGFTGVGVADYYLDIKNVDSYDNMVITDPAKPVSMQLSLSTATKSTGFTALLEAGDFKTEYTSSRICNISTMATEGFTFPDLIPFSGTRDFTITITPGFEGAVPTVISGTMIVAEATYPKVVLMEEFTSTGCSFCPRGAAFMAYYQDKYDGRDGRGRLIGSAIHENMQNSDPMRMTDNDYRPDAASKLASVAPAMAGLLPSAMWNRAGGADPAALPVDSLMQTKSVALARISRVDYTPSASAKVKLAFNLEIGYSSSDAGLAASAIVVENDVTGLGSAWAQINGFADYNMAVIISSYGQDLQSYFEPYVGTSPVLTGVKYQEVARGCYPSFDGQPLPDAFEKGVKRDFTLDFDMPSSVAKPENTAVILVVTNSATGEVLTADAVDATRFNTDIKEETGAVTAIGTEAGAEAIYFDLAGRRVAQPAAGNIYIVREADGSVRKVLIAD